MGVRREGRGGKISEVRGGAVNLIKIKRNLCEQNYLKLSLK